MADDDQKTILQQGIDDVTRVVSALEDDDQAAIVGTATKTGGKVGAAVDVGKGFKVGGEVEKSASGWGWFAGVTWRKKKKP